MLLLSEHGGKKYNVQINHAVLIIYDRLYASTNITTGLRLIQCKWLIRIYARPVTLNQYNENTPDIFKNVSIQKDHGSIVFGRVGKLKFSGSVLRSNRKYNFKTNSSKP